MTKPGPTETRVRAALDDPPEVQTRNVLGPDDATIQVTWTLGRHTSLVTARGKDHDLSAAQLRSFAQALLEAAADNDGEHASVWRWFDDPDRGRALAGPNGETIAPGEHGEVWIQDATGDIASIDPAGLRAYLGEPAEPRVTQRQLDMMRRATGRALDAERNHHCHPLGTDGHRQWTELVEMGLARRLDAELAADPAAFAVTDAGFRMVYGAVRKPRKRGRRG